MVQITPILSIVIGIILSVLGYQIQDRFRRKDKVILGIVLMILGVLLILAGIGIITLPWVK